MILTTRARKIAFSFSIFQYAIEVEAVELSKLFLHVIEAEAVGQLDPLPNYLEPVNHLQL